MFRKLILGAAAAATLGLTALAPTAASAGPWGWHHHRHWGWGHGPRVAFVVGAPGAGPGCMVKRWVPTPYGYRLRWVNRCY